MSCARRLAAGQALQLATALQDLGQKDWATRVREQVDDLLEPRGELLAWLGLYRLLELVTKQLERPRAPR